MGLKQFNADVAAARAVDFPGVEDIRRGDSEGEVVFAYHHGKLTLPVEIQVLATDSGSYPRSSGFMIFTSSEDVSFDLVSILEKLSGLVEGKTVHEVIEAISTKLSIKLDSDDDAMSDVESMLSDDAEAFYDGFESDDVEDQPTTNKRTSEVKEEWLNAWQDASSRERLKHDLLSAAESGISVGILDGPSQRQVPEMISLSIRASKLGIPAEALEAWDIDASQYLVLLLQLPRGYPTVSDFLQFSSEQVSFRMRFGKCAVPKPSLNSCTFAFAGPLVDSKDVIYDSDDKASFVQLHISKSINTLLNQQLPALLFARRSHNLSWNSAQYLIIQETRGGFDEILPPSEISAGVSETDSSHPISKYALQSLHHDFAMDKEEDVNLALVCMQFALIRLAKCAQYCMVCNQRVPEAYEAVKPYVCASPLCVYQFQSLGFGTSLEHEIIKDPHMVDILVSFFYNAALEKRSREFPQGLGLKVPYYGWKEDLVAQHTRAEAHFPNKQIRFTSSAEPKNMNKGCHFIILTTHPFNESTPPASLEDSAGARHRLLCRVTTKSYLSCSFEIITSSQNTPMPADEQQHLKDLEEKEDWINVWAFEEVHDVDDLDADERMASLLRLTTLIPPILDMRDYLLEHPEKPLSLMENANQYALRLLNWIVASNRSIIVQDQPVPDLESSTTDTWPQRVEEVDPSWMQFRFIQGSPEREQRFNEELKSGPLSSSTSHPTLFAWHGSPLGNWHSIIRTGLDFQTTMHGRAFGHGVYFSSQMGTSLGYCNRATLYSNEYLPHWPNSQLCINGAISICEVINRPGNFVSANPHYVVDKVDWIQCRYLLVRVQPTARALSQRFPRNPALTAEGYLDQDPARKLLGGTAQPVDIPLAALPVRRRQQLQAASGTKLAPVDISDDEIDDIRLVLGPEDVDEDERRGKRLRLSTEINDSQSPSKRASYQDIPMTHEQPPTPHNLTEFRPGTLDLSSLPQLPPPAWASSTTSGALRSLNREVKAMQKTQSTDSIASLGWYIDFDKFSNVFHWIVELHSFDKSLPLAQDMQRRGCSSIVLELRFGANYPLAPPFARVIRPRFLPFSQGGGGHVTIGGAICSELLTSSGWSPVLSIESVLMQIRLQICDMDPPARLENGNSADYGIGEAASAYSRAVVAHGWKLPEGLNELIAFTAGAE